MKTKVVKNIYNGKEMFCILKTDENGEPAVGQRAVVNFGITKAKAIVDHLEELKKYVDEVSK
jgi:hypothetical protein